MSKREVTAMEFLNAIPREVTIRRFKDHDLWAIEGVGENETFTTADLMDWVLNRQIQAAEKRVLEAVPGVLDCHYATGNSTSMTELKSSNDALQALQDKP